MPKFSEAPPGAAEALYGQRRRRRPSVGPKSEKSNGANLGFEAKLWQAANKLRSNMDAAEYKHVVLGPVFLKFKAIRKKLVGLGYDAVDRLTI